MSEEKESTKESGYDQKAFLQIRLHELLSNIDILNINPLSFNKEYNSFGYKVIFNNLVSVLQTISSKLKEDELGEANNMRKVLNKLIELPLYNQITGADYKTYIKFNQESWNDIQEKLYSFRCLLEKFMDSHGFNPSKSDPRGAVIDY